MSTVVGIGAKAARYFGVAMRLLALLILGVVISACELQTGLGGDPINSPYHAGAESTNTLFTAFTQRSPRYLDPARSYSSDETPYTYNIYEPLYGYHYLKRPYELIPRAAQSVAPAVFLDKNGQRLPATALPEDVEESIYEIKIKPGILFQPHPAFAREGDGRFVYYPLKPGELEGKHAITDFAQTGTRLLTAHDYVYAFRRLASPRVASPIYSTLAQHVLGFAEYGKQLQVIDKELRQAAGSDNSPPWLDLRNYSFDGVEALDDETLRIRVKGSYPQFKYWLSMTFTAPIPWEADRFYSQAGMAENNLSFNTWPVGTGPYMMVESLQNRRHILQRNPNFRGEPYPCAGEPGDKQKGLLKDCGKLTPFIDKLVFNIEKESIPLQGKFMQGYYDVPQANRSDVGVAMLVAAGDSSEKAALYAERGIQLPTTVEASIFYLGFNWLDPIVGQGATPEQAEKNRKLRQALSIAFNWEEYIAIFQQGQAEPANGPVPPGILGYEEPPAGLNNTIYEWKDDKPRRKSLEVARELLAQAGYPNGRDEKTGKPLVLYFDSAAGANASNPSLDWMRRQFAHLGVQLDIRSTDYNRFQEKMSRGVAQMFMWGWIADYPDAENFLFLLYGKQVKAAKGGENAANYSNPEYDALFERMRDLPDGAQKERIIHRMIKIVQEDAPWMFGFFPKSAGAYQQWVGNAKPSQMVRNTLQYLSIDSALRVQKIADWNRPVWWPLIVLVVVLALLLWPAWRMLKLQQRQTALPSVPAANTSRGQG
jgi:ABC-type transport system substrate-binding protein